MIEIGNKIDPCSSPDATEFHTVSGTRAASETICADAATCAPAMDRIAVKRVLREGIIYPRGYCPPPTSQFVNVHGLPYLKPRAPSGDPTPTHAVSMQFSVIVCFLNNKRWEISVIPTFQVLDLISLIELFSNTSGMGYGYMHGGRLLCNEDNFFDVGITSFALIHQIAPRR